MNASAILRRAVCGLLLAVALVPLQLRAQQTAKPVLHGKHWVAITGKPLAATAGAMMFQKGGNAVDATCAMLEPGKRPRATLTPSLALKNGKPFLSFAVQGGDSQEQNLLQFFLNVVEFGMTVQQAVEAANINSFQMRTSFGDHASKPGKLLLQEQVPPWVRSELKRMGYELTIESRTSGPINAIYFDQQHGTLWGGASHHGEDYGIAW